MKIKIVMIIGLLMILISPIYAQRRFQKMDSDKQQKEDDIKKNETQPWTEKIKYGGAISGGFSNVYSMFFVQPWVGYQINNRVMPGIGVTYIYEAQTAINYSTGQQFTVSDNIFGLNLFSKVQVVGPFTLYAEYAPINFTTYNLYCETQKIWDQQFYIGGGLYQKHSYVLILYDLLWQQWDQTNPSNFNPNFKLSPIDFRIGFVF